MQAPASKICSSCKVEKPLDEFPRNKAKRDGRHYYCKACHNAASNAWAKTPAGRAAHARARDRHREKRRAANRERYYRDIEASRQRSAETYRRNKAAQIDGQRDRRAKKQGTFVENINSLIVLELDDGICNICGEDVDPFDFEVDHVIPTSKGGEHSYANTQIAHAACNKRKGRQLPWDLDAVA